MQIKVINKSKNPLPEYQTDGAAGMDIYAWLQAPIIISSQETALLSTGIFIELPIGFEAQIRPRSGLALKHGISILNSPGTIDADYRGEIKILLINHGKQDFEIHSGDRIAQMVIAKYERISWKLTNQLAETDRGDGGYGHTGK